MEFRQLEQFLAVVDHGGLVRAAAALHIAQPSLSQTIRGLERELRTALFHRVGRGLVLTVTGEALVAPARQLMRDVDTARASVAEVSGIRSARLDLAAMGGPLEMLLPVLSDFRRRYPDVVIGLVTPTMETELVRRIIEGRSELGFLPLPEDVDTSDPRSGVEFDLLGIEPIVLMTPPGHGEELPDPLPLDLLPDLPVVAAPPGARGRGLVEEALRAAGVRTRVGVVTEHRYTQAALVAGGLGIAFVPAGQAGPGHQAGAVVRHLTPPVVVPFGIARRSGFLSPAARAFRALAVERLTGPSSASTARDPALP
ncbi:LysR family transcriptional regulator [Tsukamurella ocularis]|uniref:LysR family transcriptional regulator n=1 Tax=Tsukamurella ocularis TaxID=1970234 RepID=UPI0039F00A60